MKTEIEKGGEVALEQFHITRVISRGLNVRVGHQIVPVGLTNAHHEPINFFGTVRPEGETTPCPRHGMKQGCRCLARWGVATACWTMRLWLWPDLMPTALTAMSGSPAVSRGSLKTTILHRRAMSCALITGCVRIAHRVSAYYCRNTGANSDKSQTYKSYGRIPAHARWCRGMHSTATAMSRHGPTCFTAISETVRPSTMSTVSYPTHRLIADSRL